MNRAPTLVLLFSLFLLDARAQNGTELIQVTDLLNIRLISAVDVSPDGRNVVYTVTTIEEREGDDDEKEYEYRTQLFLVPASGSELPQQLTYGEAGASEPAWDPEGDRLAFVRDVEDKPQIFVLSMLGGEPFQLTHFEHGARMPRWSPDGTKILFASSLPDKAVRELLNEDPPWSDERPGREPGDVRGAEPNPAGSLAEIRAWLGENAGDGSPRVITRLDFQDEMSLAPRGTYDHLYAIEVDQGAEAQPVTRGFFSFGGGSWTADGEQVVFSGLPLEDLHPDRTLDRDLYIVNADGSQMRRLLDVEGYALLDPLVSPDGSTVAFLGRSLEDPGYTQMELGLVSLTNGGSPQWLTLAFDRSVTDPKWSPNGWELYFTAPSNGGFPLYRVKAFDVPERSLDTLTAVVDTASAAVTAPQPTPPIDTLAAQEPENEVEQLTDFDRGIRSYDASTATAFYVVTEPENPYELYAANQTFTQERRLTSHNADWLETKRLSLPEKHTLVRDSLEIEYWVMKPATFQEGRRYPLIVQIHGGPSAMWGPGEATMWLEFQFLASRGYGVVYSNPRGSGGYGYEFERANYQDWGTGPAGDVLAVASEVAELPWVDPDRQAVAGGSYAGYLTTWIIAHDDRFKAAVSQRGVYDLATFMGEGNAWRLVPWHFGGYPWEEDVYLPAPTGGEVMLASESERSADSLRLEGENTPADSDTTASAPAADPEQVSIRELLYHTSPLTYVDQIHTPLLIIHGDQDLRTGVSQSEMLYKSLKILERPVEYVRYPNAGHELTRSGNPKHRMDHILRTYEFIARFVE